jgi:hypothetical protein
VTQLAARQQQVDALAARLADYDRAPLLPTGAFGRIQRAQRERDDLRAALGRLRERYADAPDSEEAVASAATMPG